MIAFTHSEKMAIFWAATNMMTADGVITPEEKKYWSKLRVDLGLSAMEHVQAQMLKAQDAGETLVSMTAEKRVHAYGILMAIAIVDGHLDESEYKPLIKMREAFNLPQAIQEVGAARAKAIMDSYSEVKEFKSSVL